MSFISYAQNFEDVMLWRALKHIENGIYVDVGAQDPVIHSVSKAFYDNGWRGVHIEPVPEYADLLRQNRPDEPILEIALGEHEGALELTVVPNTGLSTSIDRYAKNAALLFDNCYTIQVPVFTLTSALHFLIGKDIHWLKIDVEGFEEYVLKGWDSQLLRPWIMVIEATIPNSSELCYENWHPIMIHAGYEFVYFDGLNRFYVAKEHQELVPAFAYPPNFFDHFSLTTLSPFCENVFNLNTPNKLKVIRKLEGAHYQLNKSDGIKKLLSQQSQELENKEQELNDLRQKLSNANDQLNNVRQEITQAHEQFQNIQMKLQATYRSRSWRVTQPLRQARQTYERIKSGIKYILQLREIIHYLLSFLIAKKQRQDDKNLQPITATRKFNFYVAVDLLPLLPGGANGGAKVMILELIKNMSVLAKDTFFTVFTLERTYGELKSLLDNDNVECVCVKGGSFDTNADLFFCPFPSASHSQKIPTISVIYDLQYQYYPSFFSSDERNQRANNFLATCRFSNHLICISNYVRQTVIENAPHFPSQRISTIPCALPDREALTKHHHDKQAILARYHLIAGDFLLYPANFWQHKNHEILLIAFAMYCTQNPTSTLQLVLTGHPCERQAFLKNSIGKMNLQKHVIFLDYVDNSTLSALMSNCLALIFPSLYEGFGMPVIEAMACGVPVLCSNVTALPEVASDAALLFDPRKPDDIVNAIKQVETSIEARDALIQKGRQRCAQFPSAEQIALQYLTVFSNVLKEALES